MGFVWKWFGFAHDFRNGITIERVNRFDDLGPGDAFPYSYLQGDLMFEFRATEYSDWRMFTSVVNTELQTMHTATYIVENSIKFGLARTKRQSIPLGEYQDLKKTIRDGMLALTTRGGYLFRFIPDFRLEFGDTEEDIPKRPPRPSDPGTVIAASLSEKPLTLGDKKDIEFVYQDYGAHDTEKEITITRIHKFEDISFDDPMPYIYSCGDLVFEFRATTYCEWRIQPNKGAPLRQHTATYVIE